MQEYGCPLSCTRIYKFVPTFFWGGGFRYMAGMRSLFSSEKSHFTDEKSHFTDEKSHFTIKRSHFTNEKCLLSAESTDNQMII